MSTRIEDIRLDGLLAGRRQPRTALDRVFVGWRAEVDGPPLPEVGPISNACTAKKCGICTPKEFAPLFAMRWQPGDWSYDPAAYRTVPYGQIGGAL